MPESNIFSTVSHTAALNIGAKAVKKSYYSVEPSNVNSSMGVGKPLQYVSVGIF